jgi:group I intron endonuclease
MHFYVITNLVTRKQYVGSTILSLEKRFKAHCNSKQPLGKEIREVGRDNFTIELLEYTSDTCDRDREAYWIEKLNTYAPHGYNAVKVYTSSQRQEKHDQKVQAYLQDQERRTALHYVLPEEGRRKHPERLKKPRPLSLTDAECAKLDALAAASRLSRSEYIIDRLGLDK